MGSCQLDSLEGFVEGTYVFVDVSGLLGEVLACSWIPRVEVWRTPLHPR